LTVTAYALRSKEYTLICFVSNMTLIFS